MYGDRLAKYCGQWREGRRWGKGRLTVYHDPLPLDSTVPATTEKSGKDGAGQEGGGNGEQEQTEADGVTEILAEGERAVYEGDWVDDLPQGDGWMADPVGGYYEGHLFKGKRHGQGLQRDGGGRLYLGEWQDDRRHGYGESRGADGESYVGDYCEGLKHGEGRCVWPDGASYEGQVRTLFFCFCMHACHAMPDDDMACAVPVVQRQDGRHRRAEGAPSRGHQKVQRRVPVSIPLPPSNQLFLPPSCTSSFDSMYAGAC